MKSPFSILELKERLRGIKNPKSHYFGMDPMEHAQYLCLYKAQGSTNMIPSIEGYILITVHRLNPKHYIYP
jgi:hypothetical protein